ncbi:MAG: polysulfide reductase NrfD [Mailhella sp.]|nr:polysulfide reductase NrfD [Mailhella sp.]
MDYSKPIDNALFPKGCERCSFTQFSLFMLIPTALLIWGVIAAFVVLYQGLGTTGLDDKFGFGLWITLDLAVIALGAGAFFTGLLRYILNIDELKNIVSFTAVVGFLCYTGAMLILVLDIGQPIRAWFGYWYPNVHSMLTEVIFCITCYCIVLIIEYIPLILEQRLFEKNTFVQHLAHNFHVYMPLFAGIGAFLSTFHQGSLGGMYGVLFGRPYIFRDGFFIWPWTFFLYLLSAVSAGPMFSVLMVTLMEKITGKKLVSWKIKQLMGKIGGTMLIVYTIGKFLDSYAWVNDVLPRSGLTFEQMFTGFVYSSIWFYAEHIALVIGIVCMALPALRKIPAFFYLGCFVTCFSIVLNRFVMTVQALGIPVMPFEEWRWYWANWAEWGAFALVLGYAIITIAVTYRYCPLFPQEAELNKK